MRGSITRTRLRGGYGGQARRRRIDYEDLAVGHEDEEEED